mgnify:CR=1 FL=1
MFTLSALSQSEIRNPKTFFTGKPHDIIAQSGGIDATANYRQGPPGGGGRGFTGDNKKIIEEELGDLFFTIINLSRRLNLDPEQTIRKANKKFITRFNEMENFIEDNKLKWHNLKKHDFKNLWNKVKNNQRGINE